LQIRGIAPTLDPRLNEYEQGFHIGSASVYTAFNINCTDHMTRISSVKKVAGFAKPYGYLNFDVAYFQSAAG
jgi:hypothetical protein